MATSPPTHGPAVPSAGMARPEPRSCTRSRAHRRPHGRKDRVVDHHPAIHRDLARITLAFERPLEDGAFGAAAVLHAAVSGEIIGSAWAAPLREVGRRANHGHFHRSHHPDDNHIGRHPIRCSDTGIESLRHDIEGWLAELEFKVNFRVGLQEALPDRCDHCRCRRMDCIDAPPCHGPASLSVQVFQRTGICWIAGRSCSSKRSPASVTDTLRVVRCSKRTARRSSSCRIE